KMKHLLLFTLALCIVALISAAKSPYQQVLQHSRIRGRQHGPNVCAMQKIQGTNKKYFTNCKQWYHRKVCGKPTVITYECCPGYEKVPGEKGCPAALPLSNIYNTLGVVGATTTKMYSERAGLQPEIEGPGSYTMFAPSNEAWAALPNEILDALVSNVNIELLNALHYHMVNKRLTSEDLKHGMAIPSMYQDFDVHIHHYPNGIVTVNCARLVKTDQHATNGMVHVVDKVITAITNNIHQTIEIDETLDTLRTAVAAAGLTTLLEKDGHFTVFAPTNEAFEKIPPETLNRILGDPVALKDLLNYHILNSIQCSEAIMAGTPMETLQGTVLEVGCEGGEMTLNGKAIISSKDHLGTNGVIHYIDELLIPDSAKTLFELAQGSTVTTAIRLFADAGLNSYLTGSDAFTLIAPQNDAFPADSNLSPFSPKHFTLRHKIYIYSKAFLRCFIVSQESQTLSSFRMKVFIHQTEGKGLLFLCLDETAILIHRYSNTSTTCHTWYTPRAPMSAGLPGSGLPWPLVWASMPPGIPVYWRKSGILNHLFQPINNLYVHMIQQTDIKRKMGNPRQLANVLKYHIGQEILVSGGVGSHTRIQPLQGERLELSMKNYTVYVNKVPVNEADMMATNGVVHAVGSVIQPLPAKTSGDDPSVSSQHDFRQASAFRSPEVVMRNEDLFQKVVRSHSSRQLNRAK
uniref:Transforming growth factor-beta-induced protein ig-h3 n=1 Tax=Lepisosteus oculatus TaxID=7918 RepID=W5N0J7_LEPOC